MNSTTIATSAVEAPIAGSGTLAVALAKFVGEFAGLTLKSKAIDFVPSAPIPQIWFYFHARPNKYSFRKTICASWWEAKVALTSPIEITP